MPLCTGLPRRAGKYAFAIRKALEKGGTIAVTREATRNRILQTAKALKMPKPKVIIVDHHRPRLDPSVTLVIIEYNPTKE